MNDFAIQLQEGIGGLSEQEFTLVALDLPGLGLSKEVGESAIKTDPTREYFELSARLAMEFMSSLKFKTYSVAGWSDGARVAALLAIRYQSRVDALILWGFVPIMDEQSCRSVAKTRDTNTWDPQALKYYSNTYGEQTFSEMWHNYVDFMVKALELPDRFDIRQELREIKCPTMILYGANDPIVNYDLHVKPLEIQINDLFGIKRFKGVAHNIHQAAPDRFNQVLSEFVMSVQC